MINNLKTVDIWLFKMLSIQPSQIQSSNPNEIDYIAFEEAPRIQNVPSSALSLRQSSGPRRRPVIIENFPPPMELADIRSTADSSNLIGDGLFHKFVNKFGELSLYRENDQLSYQYRSLPSGKLLSENGIPLISGRTADETANELRKRVVTIKEDLGPRFSKILFKWQSEPGTPRAYSKELCLIEYEKGALAWVGGDLDGLKMCIPYEGRTQASSRCNPETREYLEQVNRMPLAQRVVNLAVNCTPAHFEVKISAYIPARMTNVLLEPKSTKSQIDSELRVSKFVWSVTVVTDGGVGNFGHAQILIEGIWDEANERFFSGLEYGKYFAAYTDLTGEYPEGRPALRRRRVSGRPRYDSRSKVWMVTSQKVKRMLEVIEGEASSQSSFTFSRLGRYSLMNLFSGKKHNCITWVIEKFKLMDIDLGRSSIDMIVSRPLSYTEGPNKTPYTPIGSAKV